MPNRRLAALGLATVAALGLSNCAKQPEDGVAVATGAEGAAPAGPPAQAGPPTPSGPGELPLEAGGPPPGLVEHTRQLVAVNGGHTPSRSSYVLTTRQAAASLASGNTAAVDTDQPVYFVVLEAPPGQSFVYSKARGRRGARPPRGTQITFTVDAATGSPLDFGISDRAVNPAALGPTYRLPQ